MSEIVGNLVRFISLLKKKSFSGGVHHFIIYIISGIDLSRKVWVWSQKVDTSIGKCPEIDQNISDKGIWNLITWPLMLRIKKLTEIPKVFQSRIWFWRKVFPIIQHLTKQRFGKDVSCIYCHFEFQILRKQV